MQLFLCLIFCNLAYTYSINVHDRNVQYQLVESFRNKIKSQQNEEYKTIDNTAVPTNHSRIGSSDWLHTILGVCESDGYSNIGDRLNLVIFSTVDITSKNNVAYILFDVELNGKRESDDFIEFYFLDKYNSDKIINNRSIQESTIISKYPRNSPKINCDHLNITSLDYMRNLKKAFADVVNQLKYTNAHDLLFIFEFRSIREFKFRQDFIDMLFHVTGSVKRIENYYDKVGLLAIETVDEAFAEDRNLVDEQQKAYDEINFFLNAVKSELQMDILKMVSNNNRNMILKAIELVENILLKIGADKKIMVIFTSIASNETTSIRNKRASDACNDRIDEDAKLGAAAGAALGVANTGLAIATAVGKGATLGTLLSPGIGTVAGGVLGLTAVLFSAAVTGAAVGALGGGTEALVSKDCN